MKTRNRPGITLFLLSSLLTVGLAAPPAVAASIQALPGTYSAVITDWPKGKTGTVMVENDPQQGSVATGTVDIQGRFTIVLPTLAQNPKLRESLSQLSGLFTDEANFNLPAERQCKGQGKITPETSSGNEFSLLASVDGEDPVMLNLYSDTSNKPWTTYGSLQFYDTATTLVGVVNCTSYAQTYNGSFPEGWSLNLHPLSEFDAKTGFETQSITDLLPAAVSWHLYDAVGRVGIQFAKSAPGSAGLSIAGVVAGGAAEKAGVLPNDLLVEVDGKSVAGLNVNQVTAQIRGQVGTVITLGVMRGSETTVRRIPVTRARIQIH